MTQAIQLLAVLFALGAVAYFRVPLVHSLFIIFAILLGISLSDSSSTVVVIVLWLLYVPVALLFGIPRLRRQYLTLQALNIFRRLAPTMSETEREALEAGTVGWDAQLFSGRPDWSRLLAESTPELTKEEQAFLDGPVDELCRRLDDWRITNNATDLPAEIWDFIKNNGFFSMIIPKSYGGLEFSAFAHSAIIEKIASRSITAAVTVMVPNSLGPAKLLLHYGTEDQKNHYLPALAKGKEIPCFALTGPDAGSDAGAIPDHGVVCHGQFQGRDIIGIRLNWRKRYITLGPVATVLGLAFKLYDPDHLLGDQDKWGITLALIPRSTPGITIGRRHAPLNMAFQNGPNSGKDVFIPLDWIIGGVEYIGQGWRMLMESLADGRAISLPALSSGGSKLVCRAVGAYARIRKQFRLPIGRFEGVEEALARMAGYTYLIDAARRYTAHVIDQGEKPSVASAIVKYHLTEHMRRAVNDAMDVQGGKAICLGPRNLVGRLYQAIPISITVEGANILTRTMIIFGQGAIRCHPYARQELEVVKIGDEKEALDRFDQLMLDHIGFTLNNLARTVFSGLTGSIFLNVPASNRRLRRYLQHFTRMSSAFALTSDLSMLLLGGALKRREKISGRLADILSFLYLASTVIAQYHKRGAPVDEEPLVIWVCDYCLHRIQESFFGVMNNFPHRVAGRILRWSVFPLGGRFNGAGDDQGHRVAGILMNPGALRDRLTGGIFIPEAEDEPLQQIEQALRAVVAAEPLEKRLSAAVVAGTFPGAEFESLLSSAVENKVLDDKEAEQLRSSETLRKNVVEVDDFDFDLRTM